MVDTHLCKLHEKTMVCVDDPVGKHNIFDTKILALGFSFAPDFAEACWWKPRFWLVGLAGG